MDVSVPSLLAVVGVAVGWGVVGVLFSNKSRIISLLFMPISVGKPENHARS